MSTWIWMLRNDPVLLDGNSKGLEIGMANPRHAVCLSAMRSGHINPMLELARKLDAFGFQVSFILTPEWLSKIKHKVAKNNNIKLVTFVGEIGVMQPPSLESLEDLINSLDTPVTCLVCVLGWSQELANRLNVPRVALWTATAMAEVICSHIPILVSKGYLPVKADLEDTSLITFLPGIPPITRRQLPLVFFDNTPFLQSLGESVQTLKEAHTILLNTVEELEQQIVDARRKNLRYLPVGPLIPVGEENDARLTEEDRACLEWLDTQAPSSVLYVAFGSYASLPFAQVCNIAQGLELSKQPFLWAMRSDFATGAPEGFHQSLKDRFASSAGTIVDWTPQAKVLGHSSVGGFFTHCGWNSTMEAVWAGVPMLCWACGAEQNLNSYAIVKQWRTGFQVAEGVDGSVSEEGLAELISRLMTGDEGKEMRSRIQGLKELVRGACNEGGSSHRNLSSFVDSLC